MAKGKISTSLASVLLIASLFAGWQTLLIVVALLLIFCEIENVKGMIIRVVSFAIGLFLVELAWELIFDGYNNVVYGGINDLLSIINSYLNTPVNNLKFYNYVLDPIKIILSYCDTLVTYFILFAKFSFVVSILQNKAEKKFFFTKFIDKYVDKVVTFVNGIDTTQM